MGIEDDHVAVGEGGLVACEEVAERGFDAGGPLGCGHWSGYLGGLGERGLEAVGEKLRFLPVAGGHAGDDVGSGRISGPGVAGEELGVPVEGGVRALGEA